MRAAALLWGLAAGGCGVPPSSVVINEVTATGGDQIELFNPTPEPVDISGWAVTDQTPDERGHRYTFLASSSLLPGAYWVLQKGVDHAFSLGSDNAVRLQDASGLLIDLADYPPGMAAVSYCRSPNGTGFFQACTEATIGQSNDLPVTP